MIGHLQHIDPGALAELREVMEDDFTLLIETFLHDSADRIAQIRDALHADHADSFSRACHNFKGSCINIGVPRLAELCKRGELMGHEGNLSAAPELFMAIESEFGEVKRLLTEHAALR
jgi:histidine phosphotransfer protein HptB